MKKTPLFRIAGFKRLVIVLALLAGAAVFLFAVLLLTLSITEYRPAQIEAAHTALSNSRPDIQKMLPALDAGQTLRIVSWNIGYGGLGAKQDFFMDGGTMVRPQNKAAIEENLHGAAALMKRIDADMWFIQEIDLKSMRSFYVDEAHVLSDASALNGTYTYNFKCLFVPFPFPPLGRVASFTNLDFTESVRYALPVSFKWPVRMANLKRCLLVNRFPLTSGGELVAVNLHLEAYDEGEGKIAQTKALIDFLKAEYDRGNYVVAGGDFNQTFPGLDLSAYPAHEGLWQYYVIDGFILSPNVELKSVRILDENFIYADHNPVEIEVYLKKSI